MKFEMAINKENVRRIIQDKLKNLKIGNLNFKEQYGKYKDSDNSIFGTMLKPKKYFWQTNRLFRKEVFDVVDVRSEFNIILDEEVKKRDKAITKEELEEDISKMTSSQILIILDYTENMTEKDKKKYSQRAKILKQIIFGNAAVV